MPPDKVATARQMYESKQYTVEAIAKVLGVSRASIYRHLTDPEPAPSVGDAPVVKVPAAPRKPQPRAGRRT
jgi:predicted transcriptional regulator